MGPNKRLVFGVGSKIILEAFITGLRDGGQFLQEGQPKQKIASLNRPYLPQDLFFRISSFPGHPGEDFREICQSHLLCLLAFIHSFLFLFSCHCNHHLQHSLFPPQETPVTSWPEVSNDQLVCQAKRGQTVTLTKEQRERKGTEDSYWRP